MLICAGSSIYSVLEVIARMPGCLEAGTLCKPLARALAATATPQFARTPPLGHPPFSKAEAHGSVHMYSPVNISSPSVTADFPLYNLTHPAMAGFPLECRVGAGDAIYVPGGWWHEVVSHPDEEGKTIGVNIFYASLYHRPGFNVTSTEWEARRLYNYMKQVRRDATLSRRTAALLLRVALNGGRCLLLGLPAWRTPDDLRPIALLARIAREHPLLALHALPHALSAIMCPLLRVAGLRWSGARAPLRRRVRMLRQARCG